MTIPARYASVYADGAQARIAGLALDDFPRGDAVVAYYWRLGWRGTQPPALPSPGDITEPSVIDTLPTPATLYLFPDAPTPRRSRRRSQAEIVAEVHAERRAAAPYGALVARALRGKP